MPYSVFNSSKCGIPPITPIPDFPFIGDCGVPEVPPAITDCPDIDLPAVQNGTDGEAGREGNVGEPGLDGADGEDGTTGCDIVLTTTSTFVKVYRIEDVRVDMRLVYIGESASSSGGIRCQRTYRLDFTFYMYVYLYGCCYYRWCCSSSSSSSSSSGSCVACCVNCATNTGWDTGEDMLVELSSIAGSVVDSVAGGGATGSPVVCDTGVCETSFGAVYVLPAGSPCSFAVNDTPICTRPTGCAGPSPAHMSLIISVDLSVANEVTVLIVLGLGCGGPGFTIRFKKTYVGDIECDNIGVVPYDAMVSGSEALAMDYFGCDFKNMVVTILPPSSTSSSSSSSGPSSSGCCGGAWTQIKGTCVQTPCRDGCCDGEMLVLCPDLCAITSSSSSSYIDEYDCVHCNDGAPATLEVTFDGVISSDECLCADLLNSTSFTLDRQASPCHYQLYYAASDVCGVASGSFVINLIFSQYSIDVILSTSSGSAIFRLYSGSPRDCNGPFTLESISDTLDDCDLTSATVTVAAP